MIVRGDIVKSRAEYQRRYRAKHRKKAADCARKYYAEHREDAAEYQREYRTKHPEEVAEANRKWRANNSEKVAEDKRKYYAEHREKVAEYRRKYIRTVAGNLRMRFYGMKRRCENPDATGYHNYGGRGIKCKFKTAKEFVSYVMDELKVDPRGLQIDRIDNDGNYEPGNIRFVTAKVNSNNKRRNSKHV